MNSLDSVLFLRNKRKNTGRLEALTREANFFRFICFKNPEKLCFKGKPGQGRVGQGLKFELHRQTLGQLERPVITQTSSGPRGGPQRGDGW